MDRAVPTSGFGGKADNSRSEREFLRARRHSRLVVAMKIGLPLVAVVIVIGGVAVTWLARSLPDNVTVGSATIDNGRVVMEDPRMSGVDSSDRPYSLIARRAIQLLGGTGGIDLEEVRANLSVRDGVTADITAATGHYDPQSQKLRLSDQIAVETTDGMSIAMSQADIDITTGSMVGAGPVSITTPSQTIKAGSLAVTDGGKILSFGSGVKMTVMPSANDSPEEALTESNLRP